MSQVIFPPSHYFLGITFNSAFYNETNTDSLTQDQANKLYISKNYNDFANGIISLNGGAKADLISSIGTTSNLYEDTSLYPTKTLNIGQNNKNCNFGKYGETINIAEGGTTGLNLGYTMQPASYISLGCGSSTQDTIVAIGSKNQFPATQNNILIGATGNTTTLSSSTITFTAQPTITATPPLSTDNSQKIATTQWIRSWFNNVLNTSANTWEKVQTFVLGISTNSITALFSSSNLLIGNNLVSGNISIGANIGYFGSINLGGGLLGSGQVFARSITTTFLNTNTMSAIAVGDTMTVNDSSPSSFTLISPMSNRTGDVSIGAGGLSTANVGINNGIGSTGSVIIGTISSFLQVDANATFSALPLITASYSSIAGGDTSNTIITSYWLNTFWIPYFRGLANTWSAIQTFSILPVITASYASIAGGDTSNTIITANWINATWLSYLRGLANTWTLLQTFTAGISCTLPIRVTYVPASITLASQIGFSYRASVSGITITSTRRCQCALNATAGVGTDLPAGVYAVSWAAILRTTTTGYLAGIAVTNTVTNNVTSATGGVINLFGGIVQSSQSTTGPFWITGSTILTLDGTDCVSVGIESTTTQTNVDINCQAIRIA
jgi:hypothetical protein